MPNNRIYIGTSGWTYDDWTGPFYPQNVKGADRLEFYAEKFDTVEVNATFYRLPTENMITVNAIAKVTPVIVNPVRPERLLRFFKGYKTIGNVNEFVAYIYIVEDMANV